MRTPVNYGLAICIAVTISFIHAGCSLGESQKKGVTSEASGNLNVRNESASTDKHLASKDGKPRRIKDTLIQYMVDVPDHSPTVYEFWIDPDDFVTGRYAEYYSSGKVKTIGDVGCGCKGTPPSGCRVGEWREYYPDGTLHSLITYKDTSTVRCEDWKKKRTGRLAYEGAIRHGWSYDYDKERAISMQGNYRNGKMWGIWLTCMDGMYSFHEHGNNWEKTFKVGRLVDFGIALGDRFKPWPMDQGESDGMLGLHRIKYDDAPASNLTIKNGNKTN